MKKQVYDPNESIATNEDVDAREQKEKVQPVQSSIQPSDSHEKNKDQID